MFSKNISLIILILRIFLPICGLTVEEGVNIKELPEYSEYLRQVADRHIILTTTQALPRKSAIGPFANFPSIQLCKDAPTSSENYYTHVYCWVMLLLYALLVLSLVIYQLRSIVWLGNTIPKRNNRKENKENKEIDLKLLDEQYTDYKNIGIKSTDESSFQRMSIV